MKILILAAMDKEIDLLLNLLSDLKEINIDDIKVLEGKVGNHQVFIAKCGIGKVNAAVNTLRFVNALTPDLIINSGVAGGAGIPIGSILVANRVAYHDVWCGPGTEYGQADGIPLYMLPSDKILEIIGKNDFDTKTVEGLICSGDKFISTAEEIHFIRNRFPDVKAVDMESASIAQTCYITGTPFAIIRVVSDTPGEGENISQYKDFWTLAPKKIFAILKAILENL